MWLVPSISQRHMRVSSQPQTWRTRVWGPSEGQSPTGSTSAANASPQILPDPLETSWNLSGFPIQTHSRLIADMAIHSQERTSSYVLNTTALYAGLARVHMEGAKRQTVLRQRVCWNTSARSDVMSPQHPIVDRQSGFPPKVLLRFSDLPTSSCDFGTIFL
jgi:hypothetical protein